MREKQAPCENHLTQLLIWKTNLVYRCPLRVEETQFMSEPFMLVLPRHSLRESYLIRDPSISQSRVLCVMIKLQVILSSKSTIRHITILSRKKWKTDALQKLTICTSPPPPKFFRNRHQSSPMDLQTSRASFGRTRPASTQWLEETILLWPSWKMRNAHRSNS